MMASEADPPTAEVTFYDTRTYKIHCWPCDEFMADWPTHFSEWTREMKDRFVSVEREFETVDAAAEATRAHNAAYHSDALGEDASG